MNSSLDDAKKIEKYTRLTDYISVAQIFLKDNFFLEHPLKQSDIKERLLGHWGTSPGINLVYATINSLISKHKEKDFIYVVGPGHGFPAFQANLFVEGSLSSVYKKKIPYTRAGMEKVMQKFSVPYGYPSHLNPEAPGVILEGGELGYSLAVAGGSVLDNPNLVTVCLIGDGEAETGPLAAAWNINRFINPGGDGAVLPVLHLNGYKISGPTVFGRMTDEEITKFFEGHGYDVNFIDSNKDVSLSEQSSDVFSNAIERINMIQGLARAGADTEAPSWPVIIMRTPKGMGCPEEINGEKIEGNHLSHQVVFSDLKGDDTQLKMLEDWLASYKIDELVSFDDDGGIKFDKDIEDLIPSEEKSVGLSKHSNGGVKKHLALPDINDYVVECKKPGERDEQDEMFVAGKILRDIFKENKDKKNFRLFSPDETYSNHLQEVFKETTRAWQWPTEIFDKDISRDGRVVEILSEHTLFGMLLGYTITGRYGMFVTYESFAQIVASMADQYVKFLKVAKRTHFRKPVPAVNVVLSSLLERQDHNGFSHQNPSFISSMLDRDRDIVNTYFPADKNVMAYVMKKSLLSVNAFNVIVAGKKMHRTWLTPKQAQKQVDDGVMIWDFLSEENPDLVLATCGDYVTEEAVFGAKLFKDIFPDIALRFVNVCNLDRFSNLDAKDMVNKFLTQDKGVVFNYHGYPATVKKILFGSGVSGRIIINGYEEEGSTTSPFDMKARNGLSRYDVVKDLATMAVESGVISYENTKDVLEEMDKQLKLEKDFIKENFVDPEYIKNPNI